MAAREARSTESSGPVATRAELEALCAVTAATVEMAEAARSEAAVVLLRRALSLVRGRCAAAGGSCDGERAFTAP